jgi:DNA polymerase III subunit delta'
MKAQIARSICPWLSEPMAQLAAAADRGRLGHGWLISGARGIGKSNLAYVLAGRLLGPPGSIPPPVAGPRAMLAAYAELAGPVDLHADLHRVRHEEDKRTISVEQVRAVTADLALTPHQGDVKVVVMECADTMTIEAANALLKSLEEPTPNTYLLLLAERPGRLPATIRSRCQHLAVRGPKLRAARDWLAADHIETGSLPDRLLHQFPITAARLASDPDMLSKYKELRMNIDLILEGEGEPHDLAESWAKGDTELALETLIAELRDSIRDRLVPGHSNLVTDPDPRLAQNPSWRIGVDALFAGLQMAENLREQLGRGVNVELALKSILVGLERGDARRLHA